MYMYIQYIFHFHRVCAPGEDSTDQFTLHPPQLHTFPPSPLTPHSSLQVSVHHLPRLKDIPSTLTPHISPLLTPHTSSPLSPPHCNIIDHFKDLSLSDSARSYHITPSLHTPHTSPPSHTPQQEAFPFSPPQPSPMSPKLLAGLGEPLQYHSMIGSSCMTGDCVTDHNTVSYHGDSARDKNYTHTCKTSSMFERSHHHDNQDKHSNGRSHSGSNCKYGNRSSAAGDSNSPGFPYECEPTLQKYTGGSSGVAGKQGKSGGVRRPAASSPVSIV